MPHKPTNPFLPATVLPVLLAVSACSSSGFSAGAPSEHVSQSYETLASTAATTSTLGGSAIVLAVPIAGVTSVAGAAGPTTGSLTHDTGRIRIFNGTYNFIDPDGPDGSGQLDDGAGATSYVVTSTVFTGTYSYVEVNNIQRNTATEHRASAGVIGIMTAAADMPSGGTATYTGEASAETLSLGVGTTYDYNHGTSTVVANFGAGTVDVTLDAFTQVEKIPFGAASSIITAAAAPLDQIHGSGLAINGTHFTGGSWQTLKGGVAVDVVGAGAVTTSNGTFYGYDSAVSAPAEVGGVVFSVAPGGTSALFGIYIAK